MGTIIDRLHANADDIEFVFFNGAEGEVRLPGRSLVDRARALAGMLHGRGVRNGDRVVIVLPTSEALVLSIFATWMCRAAVVILPHRLGSSRASAEARALAAMIDVAKPALILGFRDAAAKLDEAGLASVPVLCAEDFPALEPADALDLPLPGPQDLAVLQFSSGSTRAPQAVVLSHGMVLENTDRSTDRAYQGKSDVVCSWLPVYHDFGLISAVVFPVARGIRSVLIPTERFIAQPTIWFEAISRYSGTTSATPPFGLDLMRLAARQCEALGLDISSWRYVWLAAEPIFPARVRAFIARFAALGLQPLAIRPAYGLAEAVVGVSVSFPGQPIRTLWVDQQEYRQGRVVEREPGSEGALEICGCGSAIEGSQIRIGNAQGEDLGDRVRGRILVRGPSVCDRYWPDIPSPKITGWLDTGDEGFLVDGELFVCGRTKDTLIRGGVKFDAHLVESAVCESLARELPSAAPKAAVVFASVNSKANREDVVALVEGLEIEAIPEGLFDRLRSAVLQATGLAPDVLALLDKRRLPRTTSGKLKRAAARELYEAGACPVV